MFGLKPMEMLAVLAVVLVAVIPYIRRDSSEQRRETARVLFHAIAASFCAMVLLYLWSAYRSNGW